MATKNRTAKIRSNRCHHRYSFNRTIVLKFIAEDEIYRFSKTLHIYQNNRQTLFLWQKNWSNFHFVLIAENEKKTVDAVAS